MPRAVGIDLGTTYSCVGVWQRGQVEIIANDQGNRTTPSCVAFSHSERLVGEGAKNQVSTNPQNTVFDVKRLIGRASNDPKIQEDLKTWPFKVVDDGGRPRVQVTFKGAVKLFTPEEISSMVLSKMKATAESYLGHKVADAVITVPAYFNDSQRQATKDAGHIAGLNVMRIINEPTAAALAYGLDRDLKGERNVLIYDLGGGTFDVSVLTINGGSLFEVISTAGDTHLGGEDFDTRLVNHLANEFQRKTKKDLRVSLRYVGRLRTAAERAKRTLSSSTEAAVEIDALFDGVDFFTKISRAKFDALNEDLFKATLPPLEKALQDTKLTKNQISDIVLVGGSTRIPKIQKMLKEFFNGRELNMSINPDEAVAYGAAVQAAILSGDSSSQLQDVLLVDIAPLSLGVETVGGVMEKIVERNVRIPCKHTKAFTTYHDNQTAVAIKVFEGERVLTKDNNLLGTFELSGLPPLPHGSAKIDVSFGIDVNSILNVVATDVSSGRHRNLVIQNSGRLTKEEIDKMEANSKRYETEDLMHKERIQSRNQLESYVFSLRSAAAASGKLSKTEKDVVLLRSNEILKWLENNNLADKSDNKLKMEELKSDCASILKKLRQNGNKSGPIVEEVE